MRIISGKYKGKNIMGYDIDGTRPTQDRVKESLFAMIQEELIDSTSLDLFAGSGNLGIEALSNGSSKCFFVDKNKKCCEVINKNLSGIDNGIVINKDYNDALIYFKDNSIKFDIMFLDPPYNLDCLDDILNKVCEYNLLNPKGLVICEYEYDNFKEYDHLEIIKDKKYGYKNIRIYRSK